MQKITKKKNSKIFTKSLEISINSNASISALDKTNFRRGVTADKAAKQNHFINYRLMRQCKMKYSAEK